MNKQQSRRAALKMLTAGVAASGISCSLTSNLSTVKSFESKNMRDNWQVTHNRTWLGGDFWANPMEDWHIVDGGAQCKSGGAIAQFIH
ncbi:MAG: twin-arginine translocation signal domain-containing protein [Thalassotalea sp.]